MGVSISVVAAACCGSDKNDSDKAFETLVKDLNRNADMQCSYVKQGVKAESF